MVTIAICSPVPALRAGLRALISADPDLSVAAVASSLADLAKANWGSDTGVSEPQFAVIIATPGGIADTQALPPGVAVLLVSDEVDEAEALQLLHLNAWGVVSPEAHAEALQAAVRALAEGLVVVEPGLYQRLREQPRLQVQAGEGEAPVVDRLTGREMEVLQCIAQGLTNKQIALNLHISEHTVKFHVSSIYSKLGVSSRTEALRRGARLGFVPL